MYSTKYIYLSAKARKFRDASATTQCTPKRQKMISIILLATFQRPCSCADSPTAMFSSCGRYSPHPRLVTISVSLKSTSHGQMIHPDRPILPLLVTRPHLPHIPRHLPGMNPIHRHDRQKHRHPIKNIKERLMRHNIPTISLNILHAPHN